MQRSCEYCIVVGSAAVQALAQSPPTFSMVAACIWPVSYSSWTCALNIHHQYRMSIVKNWDLKSLLILYSVEQNRTMADESAIERHFEWWQQGVNSRRRQYPLWPAGPCAIITGTSYYSQFDSLKMNSLVVFYQWKKSLLNADVWRSWIQTHFHPTCDLNKSQKCFSRHMGQAWLENDKFATWHLEQATLFLFILSSLG